MSTPPRARAGPTTRTVGVVGAGRVGPVLGAALAAAGHRVPAVSTGSRPERVRALLPEAAILPATAVARAGTDLLLLAVPDDALPQVVAELAPVRPDQVLAHTSGSHGLDVLRPAGGQPLALHPAMTFTGEPADLDRLPGISYGVTAPDRLRRFATRLVAELDGVVEWIDDANRRLYHAALAHGANHLVTLVNEAADRLRQAGVREPARLLAPLLRAALENVLRLGDPALTGPVARGDAGTVAGHLRALAVAAPESVSAYRALARRTADRAIATGRLSPAAAEPLLNILQRPTGAAWSDGAGITGPPPRPQPWLSELADPDAALAELEAAPASAWIRSAQ